MTFVCKYGHKHRTQSGVEYCHVNVPWHEKASQIKTTPWVKEGTTDTWCELGTFRDLFWGPMRDRIILRDGVCQYENCGVFSNLEVHHIITRRLGGSDHPANLISLCHNHHKIQASHYYDVGIILCGADIDIAKNRKIRQARPKQEQTLSHFGID